MDRDQIIKIMLMFVFLAVLIAGIPITVKNYNRWSSVSTSVVREFKKPDINTKSTEDENNMTSSGNLQGSGNKTTDNPQMITEDQTEDNSQDTNADQTGSESQDTDIEKNEVNSQGTDTDTGNLNGSESNSNSTNDQRSNDSGTNEDGLQNTENSQIVEDSKNEEDSRDDESSDLGNEPDKNTENAGKANMEGFYISTISDDIFSRIRGRSYPEDCPISRDELRYVHIRHYGFEGEIRDGELIVNAAIAEDVMEIFEELYEIKYQIEKVRLIDEYDADDERSMEDNNSSCFNYRTIAESSTLSNHAYGRAIDINPFYNPYVYTRSDGSQFLQPKGSDKYVDRTVDAACIIRNGDACYNIFAKHGFTWGGDWNTKKDYQHFEKNE